MRIKQTTARTDITTRHRLVALAVLLGLPLVGLAWVLGTSVVSVVTHDAVGVYTCTTQQQDKDLTCTVPTDAADHTTTRRFTVAQLRNDDARLVTILPTPIPADAFTQYTVAEQLSGTWIPLLTSPPDYVGAFGNKGDISVDLYTVVSGTNADLAGSDLTGTYRLAMVEYRQQVQASSPTDLRPLGTVQFTVTP